MDQQLIKVMLLNTLGLSILAETLIGAEKFICSSSSNSRMYEYKQCYAFVQGTGLDILLDTYHLGYDADSLRSGFNYYLKKAGSIH